MRFRPLRQGCEATKSKRFTIPPVNSQMAMENPHIYLISDKYPSRLGDISVDVPCSYVSLPEFPGNSAMLVTMFWDFQT